MKAIILAAGYATRLYPLTENTAKPLLEVGGKPIIDHILDKIYPVKEINQIYIITNNRFYPDFLDWTNKKQNPKLTVVNDHTKSNEDRLGAIGDIYFVMKEQQINNEDLLVIAGDNLFEFSLPKFVEFFRQKQSSIVALCDLKDKDKVKGKFGVAILNDDRIIDFQEKPEVPKSALASTACYLFDKEDLEFIQELATKGITDPPGLILNKLVQESELNGFVFTESWFDIGSFENLKEARKFYEN